MDRIKSICIEEELCQSHDGSLEQILKQMLSYKKLYNVILRAEKGETYNSIKNRYSLGFLEETDLGSKMEIEFQTDSFEILSKQLIEYTVSFKDSAEGVYRGVKKAFQEAHIYITSDNDDDVRTAHRQFFRWKKC